MTISEFVVDSELFLKISSSDSGYQSLMELLRDRVSNRQFNQDEVMECKYFYELLKSIKQHKCKLVYNDKIKKEYNHVIQKCPIDIKIAIARVLSERACYIEHERKLNHKCRFKLSNTPLKNKIHYIDAAHLCENNKLIVSTKDFIDSNYRECQFDLIDVGITCENVFYVIDHVNG